MERERENGAERENLFVKLLIAYLMLNQLHFYIKDYSSLFHKITRIYLAQILHPIYGVLAQT